MDQLPDVECAANLHSIYSAQAETIANSNLHTLPSNLVYHGQQHTTSYDPPCRVIHQLDKSAD
jgi:hypothetical protein